MPEAYLPGSNKKVWWQCDHGHEWEASIYDRVSGTGCPYCSGRKATSDNNLAVKHPELMSEWHPTKNKLTPHDYLPKSNLKVWWQCIKGHEWQSVISNRANGNGCPKCTHQTSKNELRIFTELATVFDEVRHRHKIEGVEADVFLPEYKIAIEYDGKYWHQDKAEQDHNKQVHLWEHGIALLRVREKPLTKLQEHDIILPMGSFITKDVLNRIVSYIDIEAESSRHYIDAEEFLAEETYLTYLDYFPSPFPENSLTVINPELASEWHPTKNSPLTPDNFTQSAKPKVWWMCIHGHEWQATIHSRNLGGHACPTCMGFKATDENCMAVTHPHLAELFHPTKNGQDTPQTLKAGAGKKLWWQCKNGHEWQQTGDKLKRLVIDEPCRKCRSLAVKRPDIAAMWHPTLNEGLTPEDVAFSSGKNRWWQCTVDHSHQWQTSPNNMVAPNRKTFCPHCR